VRGAASNWALISTPAPLVFPGWHCHISIALTRHTTWKRDERSQPAQAQLCTPLLLLPFLLLQGGRFSGRLPHKQDELALARECELLGPLVGGWVGGFIIGVGLCTSG
jgi:hypothetical protein